MFSERMPIKKRKSISQRVPKRKRKVSDCSDGNLQSKTLRIETSAGSSSCLEEPTPGCSTDSKWSMEANAEQNTGKQASTPSAEGMSNWKRVEAQDLISEDLSHRFSAQSKDTPVQQGILDQLKIN